MALDWIPRPSFKSQSSMFTLFLIFPCSFIVHGRAAPSPVSNLLLDRSRILPQTCSSSSCQQLLQNKASESRVLELSDNRRIMREEKSSRAPFLL